MGGPPANLSRSRPIGTATSDRAVATRSALLSTRSRRYRWNGPRPKSFGRLWTLASAEPNRAIASGRRSSGNWVHGRPRIGSSTTIRSGRAQPSARGVRMPSSIATDAATRLYWLATSSTSRSRYALAKPEIWPRVSSRRAVAERSGAYSTRRDWSHATPLVRQTRTGGLSSVARLRNFGSLGTVHHTVSVRGSWATPGIPCTGSILASASWNATALFANVRADITYSRPSAITS